MIDTIGINVLGLSVDGQASITESIFDFPTFTLSEYVFDKTPTRNLGDSFILDGLTFTIDKITVDFLPEVLESVIQKPTGIEIAYSITYSGSHCTKKLVEFPINVREFVNYGTVDNIGRGYTVDLKDLIPFVKNKSGFLGNVNIPNYKIFLDAAEGSEYVAINNYLTDLRHLLNLTYAFNGDTLTLSPFGQSPGSQQVNVYGKYSLNLDDTAPSFNKTLLNVNNYPEYNREYIELDTDKYYIYQGDESPQVPPLDISTIPKNQTIMYGGSNALTRSYKLSVFESKQILFEIDVTFGYAHALIELSNNNTNLESTTLEFNPIITAIVNNAGTAADRGKSIKNLLSDQALGGVSNLQSLSVQGYEQSSSAWVNPLIWKVVRCVITDYEYKPVTLSNVESVFRILNEDGTSEPVELPQPFIDAYSKSNFSILSRKVTQGFDYRRFADEASSTFTNSSMNAYNKMALLSDKIAQATTAAQQISRATSALWMQSRFQLEQYLYKKVPIVECTEYSYAPYSKFYKDEQYTGQFQTLTVRGSDIGSNNSNKPFVTIVVPDPNWQPNVMLTGETTYKRSVAVQGNPNWNPFSRNYYGNNPYAIYTGTEEETVISYSPLPSYNTTSTVTDNSFTSTDIAEARTSTLSTLFNFPLEYTKPGLEQAQLGLDDGLTLGLGQTLIFIQNKFNQVPQNISTFNANLSLIDEDFYVTRIKTRSAQNAGYKDGAFFESYNIETGRPPNAITKKDIIELRENRDPNYSVDYSHYLKSNIVTKNVESNYSNSLTNNLQSSITAATNYLIHTHLKNSNTIRFSVFPTAVRIGDYISVDVPGDWRIIETVRSTTKLGQLVFSQEIPIVAGELKKIELEKETVPKTNRSAKYSNYEKSGKINIDFNSISANLEKSQVDLSGIFSSKGFGRFVDLNGTAKVDPGGLIQQLKGLV